MKNHGNFNYKFNLVIQEKSQSKSWFKENGAKVPKTATRVVFFF